MLARSHTALSQDDDFWFLDRGTREIPSYDESEPNMTVDELDALNDADLAQFIEKNRQPDGSVDLPINGWDKLSNDERRCLAERLT